MIELRSPVAGCMRWGKWGANFSTTEYLAMIEACVEKDIRVFDHADIYGDYTTEEEFGHALRGDPALKKEIILITKCGIQMVVPARPHHAIKSYNTSRQHIIDSAERSLKNFGTDHLDVLLLHRPDPLLHPAEVAEAVHHLKQSGKILHFGVSNFLPHQVNMLKKYVDVEYNQVEISLMELAPFTNGVLDNCIENGIIPLAWAPLGGGIFSDDTHPRYRSIVSTASALAEKYDTGVNQLLIAWLLSHPSGILPVVGTTKIERLVQARQAGDITLSLEDWFALYTASTGEDVA